MASTNIEQLEKQIEAMIRDHVAEVRRRAALAVERAFGSSVVKARRTRPARRAAQASRGEGRRRNADELSELGDRLYATVTANPGETMSILATTMGVTPRELNRPAKALKSAGRLRCVGERNMTRYFPMPTKGKAA